MFLTSLVITTVMRLSNTFFILALKPQVASSSAIAKLSENFVMVNTEVRAFLSYYEIQSESYSIFQLRHNKAVENNIINSNQTYPLVL